MKVYDLIDDVLRLLMCDVYVVWGGEYEARDCVDEVMSAANGARGVMRILYLRRVNVYMLLVLLVCVVFEV